MHGLRWGTSKLLANCDDVNVRQDPRNPTRTLSELLLTPMQVLIAALRISGRLKIFAATAKVAGARFGAAQPRSASAFRDGVGPSGRPPLHMLARQWCCFDVEAAVLRKW